MLFLHIHPTHAQLQDIQNGDLIQVQGLNDIYIVKRTNNKAFKRLILNPTIFNAYPTFNWNNIKRVNQETFNAIITSDLITPNNNQDIYRLFPSGDMGVKAKIELTISQIQEAGIDTDSIFKVNDNEYSEMSYPSIDPITTIQQLRSGQLYISNMEQMSIRDIQDGDLIRTNNQDNIYIAKRTQENNYKRPILNPALFQAYGHLRFQNVKTISNQDIQQFQTSNLIQQIDTTQTYKVFPLNNSGLKRLIQTNNLCNLTPDAVYIVNNMELSLYQTGPPITNAQECQGVVTNPDGTTTRTPQTGAEDAGIPIIIEDDDNQEPPPPNPPSNFVPPSIDPIPQVPVSLMVVSQTQITAQWTAVVGAHMYDVRYRQTGNSNWTLISTNSIIYQATQLTPNTQYEFQVRGTSNAQNGAWSTLKSATTTQNLIIPQPTAPTLSSITQTTITVSWTNVSNASNYDIRHKPMASSVWTTLTNQSSPTTITNLTADTIYQIQVRGTTQTTTGPWSSSAQDRTVRPPSNFIPPPPPPFTTNPVVPTPPPPQILAPVQVTNVSVTSTTDTSLTISWTTQSQADAYEVQYKTGSASYTTIQPDPTTSPATITGLNPDTTYTIQVRATAEQGMSTMYGDWSSDLSATTSLTLAQPQNISVSTQQEADTLAVSWMSVMHADQYQVQYCAGVCTTSNWTEEGSETATTNSIRINNLTPAETYSFRVRAQATKQDNTQVQSAWSSIDSLRVELLKPANLVLTSVNDTTINAAWTPVAGATNYDVWHCTGACTNDSDWTKASTTTSRYAITGLTAATMYKVRVRGTHNTAQSPWTEAQASSDVGQVTGFSVDSTTTTTINLSWDAVSGATGYTVRRRHRIVDLQNLGGSTWSDYTEASSQTTSHQFTGLNPGIRYEVSVIALNGSTTIAQSPPNILTSTKPSQVTGVSATTGSSNTSLNVSWDAFTIASGFYPTTSQEYDVRYRTGSNEWTQMDSASQTTSTQLTGLTADTTYSVQVRVRMYLRPVGAPRIDILGEWSSSASATTVSPPMLQSVTGVTITQGSAHTELSVSWDTQAQATRYTVRYRVVGAAGWDRLRPNPTTSPATITGLTAGTQYEIRIRARDDSMSGPFSDIVMFTTSAPDDSGMPSEQVDLTQVTNVSATSTMSSTELMISWDTQTGATGYDVEYRLSSTAPSGSWTMDTATTSPAVVMSLTASTSYQIRVRAKTQTQTGDWSTTVTQSTADAPISPPTTTLTQVTNVVVSQTTENTELSVAFDTQTTATSYDVEYRLSSTAPSGLWSMSTTTSTPHTLTSLTTGSSYQVRVRATTQTETGDWSDTQTQSTPDPPAPPPAPTLTQVTNVAVSTTSESTELSIAFDTQDDATSYDIEHRAGSGAWTMNTATTSPVLLMDLTASTAYQVRVRAKTATETGDWSATATQTTPSPPPPTPTLTQVISVTVSATPESDELSVSFDTQNDATSYDVEYRLTSTAPSGLWSMATATSSPKTLTGLMAGSNYQVRVRAITQTQMGAWSATVTQTTADPLPPGTGEQQDTLTQVTSVVASPTTDSTELSVAFDTQNDATSYDVEYRLTSTAPSGLWSMATATSSPKVLTGLMAGSNYQVRVRATTATEMGDWSSIATQNTPDAIVSPPVSPRLTQVSNVSATSTMSSAELMVSWDTQTGATGYDVEYRPTSAAPSGPWDRDTATTSPATLAGLTASTNYQIRVRATTATATGDWSATATQTTASAPAPTLTQVTNVSASTTMSTTELMVSWGTQAGATGYDIEYRLTSSAPSGLWTMDTATTSPATVTGLVADTSYQIRVRAKTATQTGDWSDIATQTTPADAPVSTLTQVRIIQIERISNDSLGVIFNTQANATSYDVSYRAGLPAIEAWTTRSATTNPIRITGLTASTNYQIRVRAKNATQTGEWSTIMFWTTARTPLPTSPTATKVTNVVATQGTDGTQLHIAYDTQSGIDSYALEYRLADTSPNGLWSSFFIQSDPTTMRNLTPNTAYQIRVRAAPDDGYGEWSDIITATTASNFPAQPQPLPQVADLSVAQGITNTDFAVSFTPEPQAIIYDIAYRLTASAPSGLWSTLTAFVSPVTISGLTPNTSYQIRVRGKNATQTGDWSDIATQITASSPTSSAPEILTKVLNVSTRDGAVPYANILVAFATQASAQRYTIEYRLSNSAPSGAWTALRTTSSPVAITGLTADTSYQIRVRAERDGTTGEFSDIVTETTDNTQPLAFVARLRGVLVTRGTTNTELVVSFEERALTTIYDIQYRTILPSGYGEWSTITATTSPATITGLTPSTLYQVVARARNAVDISFWSSLTSVHSRQSTSPLFTSVNGVAVNTGASDSELSVSFMLQAQATGYDVAYRPASAAPNGAWSVVSTTTSPATLTGLDPNTIYQVSVRANNSLEHGPWSRAVGQSTSITLAQLTIADLRVEGDTSIIVEFPTQANASQYEIEYQSYDSFLLDESSGWDRLPITIRSGVGNYNILVLNLEPGTPYVFRARAKNGTATGPWSYRRVATTSLKLGQVSQITTTQTANNSISISSFPAVRYAQNYEMRYKKSTDATWTNRSGSFSNSGATLTGLDTETQYDIQVRARTPRIVWSSSSGDLANTYMFDVAYGPWSDTVNATTTLTLAKVTGVSASYVQTSQEPETQISWNSVSGALEYYVQWCNTICNATDDYSDPDWITHAVDYAPGLSTYQFQVALLVGETYKIRIRAQATKQDGSAVYGAWSDILTYTVPVRLPTPEPPMILTLSSTSIRVYWSLPHSAGVADRYEIRYTYTDALGDQVSQSEFATGSPATISNLSVGVAYTIDIRAQRQVPGTSTYTSGDWSTSRTGTPINLPRVTGVSLNFPDLSSMQVSWNSVPDADSYEVEYTPSTTNVPVTVSPNPTTNTTEISGLSIDDTSYTVRVRARSTLEDSTTIGYGDWSTGISGPTFLPKAQTPMLSSDFPTHITVAWSETVAGAEYYDLRYKETSSSEWMDFVLAGYSDDSAGLLLLEFSPATQYEFQVRGAVVPVRPLNYTNTFGVWSDVATITTGDRPPAPRNFQVSGSSSSDTVLDIAWDTDPGVRYQIQVCKSNCASGSSWQIATLVSPSSLPPGAGTYASGIAVPTLTRSRFSGSIHRLEINTVYQVRVRGYYDGPYANVYSNNPATGSASTNISNPPGPPTNVNAQLTIVGGVTTIRNRITASWSPVAYAEEYEVQYAFEDLFDSTLPPRWSQSTTTSSPSTVFDGVGFLGGNASIRVRSKATNNSGTALYSNWVEVPVSSS